jgi:Ca2+-binding EF-hand superfamily protein
MSSISTVGGASSAWAAASSARADSMKDKMFAKVDADGSGGVNKAELQTMFDKIASKTGSSPGTAEDMLSKMDSDGSGELSKTELDTGMKSLSPKPTDTMAFAQQREQGGPGGAGGPKGPPPGPPPAGGSGEASETSSSEDIDPLDLNSDGTVSAQEKAAGELKEAMKTLMAAVDSDGDQKISSDEAVNFASQLTAAVNGSSSDTSTSSSSSNSNASTSTKQDSASLSQMLMQAYSRAASNYAQASQLSLSA